MLSILLKKYFSLFLFSYFMLLMTKFVFYFYLQSHFETYSFGEVFYAILWGYRFDFAIVAVVTFIAMIFDFHKKTFALISSFLVTSILSIQLGDILYYNDSSRHISYEISSVFNDANSLFSTAYEQHFIFTILSLVSILFISIFSYKLFIKQDAIKITKITIIEKLVVIGLTIFFVRGMFQHIPLNPWQSQQIGENKLSILALNSSYNLLYMVANKKKKLSSNLHFKLTKLEIDKSLKELYADTNVKENRVFLKKPNVVFFFLESWSGINMKSYGYNKEVTPFFDSILSKSIRPKAMIAGGHRTTEGIFATLTSLQNPLGKSVAKTQLQDLHYISIVKLLSDKLKYTSAFFQGTSKETSGTGSFAQTLGFTNSYGKRDVVNKIYKENTWGVQDVDLYNFAFDRVNSMSKPFVIGINGATTHDDKIPKEIKSINFTNDKKRNKILNTLHFSDMALKSFVEKIQHKYPNTLFVFFADHCGSVKGSSFENYLIPFALYHKDLVPKYYDVMLSQRDIAPTIYDIVLGDYHKEVPSFSGKSLFSDKDFFSTYYHNGILAWVGTKEILEVNTITNKNQCYSFDNLFKQTKKPCSKEAIKQKKKLLAFTIYSQKLLFEGKTYSFRKGIK